MADIAITFGAPMIHALWADQKTQTRRLAWREKKDPGGAINDGGGQMDYIAPSVVRSPSRWTKVNRGDRLWVREAFAVVRETLDYETGGEYDAFEWDAELYGDPRPYLKGDARGGCKSAVYYLADGEDVCPGNLFPTIGLKGELLREAEIPTRAPRRMPRWASRMTLHVTEKRVQKLHEITDEDALAEGVVWSEDLGAYHVPGLPHPDPEFPVLCRPTAREMFAALWDTIHRPGAWLGNPEVVAMTFTVATANIDADPDAATGCADDALPASIAQAARAWLDGRGTP